MNIDTKQMTTAEKMRAMEALWDDLCHQAADIPSPEWHGDLLSQREEALSKGSEAATDWEEAKKKIRDQL